MTDTADPVKQPTGQQQNRTSAPGRLADNGIISEEQANEMRFLQRDDESDTSLSEDQLRKLKPYIFTGPEETMFQYPMKVGETDDQPHSVRFYINARSNSRVAETTNVDRQSIDRDWAGPMPPLETANSTSENRKTAEQAAASTKGAAGVAGFTIGTGAGTKFVNMLSGGNGASALGKSAGAVVGGLTGAGIAALISNAVIEVVKKVRTLGVIELYVSAPPVAQYSANWENKDLGPLAGLSDGFSVENLLGEGGLGDLGVRGLIRAAANLPSQFGIGGELGASLDLASAKVANPYKEQLFSNMGFRTFAFNYKFTPRNQAEYEQVKRIIQLFKYHMHPEVSPSKLFLEYPSEFEIKYFYKGEENEHLSKISSCALTDVKITYGNQDAFTTVKGQNGVPAEINMQLAFTELETLTNERIADGF